MNKFIAKMTFLSMMLLFLNACKEAVPEISEDSSLSDEMKKLKKELANEIEKKNALALEIEASDAARKQALLDQKAIQDQINVLNKSDTLISQPVKETDFENEIATNAKTIKNAPKNVIMVFIDTLRKDHVNPANAPEMSQFLKDGWSFKHSYASGPITHMSSFAMFYSQNTHLRDAYVRRNWEGGSPFLRSLKNLGYTINIWGSPWQYCIDGSFPIINESLEVRNGAISNLYLLYGKRPKNLMDSCYKYFDYDLADPMERRDPFVYQQDFPRIPFLSDTWERYNGDFNKNGSNKIPYYHQAYLDHKIVSDAIHSIDTAAPASKNFHLVYLFSVHDPFAWLDEGLPKGLEPGVFTSKFFGKGVAPSWSPEALDYAPWKAIIDEKIGDVGPGGIIPTYHTPQYSEYNSFLYGAYDSTGAIIIPPNPNFKPLLKRMYKNAVAGADYQFHRLIDHLKKSGLYDDALIILVSDHGKFIFETTLPNLGQAPGQTSNDKLTHFGPPFRQNTEVPIAYKFPKDQDARVDSAAKEKEIGSHLDIFPTVIDYISPDLYKGLKSHRLISGSSVLEHDRKCVVSQKPDWDYINDFVINNGKTKMYLRFDVGNDVQKPNVDRKSFYALAFLDQDDNYIYHDGKAPDQYTVFEQQQIARDNFGECIDELFPRYSAVELAEFDKEKKKFELFFQIERINALPDLKSKFEAFNLFPGEQIRAWIYGNESLGPQGVNYMFMDDLADKTFVENYLKKLSYTPANIMNDFRPLSAAEKNSLLATCTPALEPKATFTDFTEHPYIQSLLEPKLIKGPDSEYFFPNAHYFKTHNYQNLPPIFFEKLAKNKRVVSYSFNGTKMMPEWVLTNGFRRNNGAASSLANIDLLNYYGGEQNGTLAGFFSTSRSVNVSKYFAHTNTKLPIEKGYVYAILVEGGIMDPPNKKALPFSGINYIDNKNSALPLVSPFNEQEIVSPIDVPPWKIVAYRQMKNRKGGTDDHEVFDPTEPVYVRKGLDLADPNAFKRIAKALGGCPSY